MKKNALVVLVLATGMLAGCKKNSDGDVVVQTPRVTTQTDTVKMPVVETSKDTITTVTPKLEVKKDTNTMVVPKVTVHKKP
ncbi:MAG TPA: hypothetical protein VK511_13405 [Gemmatimonadaceae bacterium]|nr:hypothetical protein [Gemmatimonadaceae bacterium]